jgi:hypothetical protein
MGSETVPERIGAALGHVVVFGFFVVGMIQFAIGKLCGRGPRPKTDQ